MPEQPPAESLTTKKWWKPALLSIKRGLVLLIAIMTIYVGVGSCLFAPWWFGLVWAGNFNLAYMLEGLTILRDEYFALLMGIVIAAFLAALAGITFKAQLVKFVDRFSGRIVVVSAFTLVITALTVYHVAGHSYWRYSSDAFFEKILLQANTELTLLTDVVPRVATPVDFRFIDRVRIEALYNQIEPDLIEKERTVASTGSTEGKAGIAAGPITAEAQASKGTSSTSSFAQTTSSVERKCIRVMNYVVEHRDPRYYTGISDAIKRRKGARVDWSRLKPIRPLDEKLPTPEELEAERQTDKKFEGELSNELRSLTGFVFIDGEFTLTVSAGTLTLLEQFSEKPYKVLFRVNIPTSSCPDLVNKHKLRLRVFGDVLRPLDDRGYVDIQGVAIY